MLDIKLIREQPELVKENCKKKFQEDKLGLVDEVLEKDAEYRQKQYDIQKFQSRRNELSKEIAMTKKSGGDASALMEEAKDLPEKIDTMQQEIDALQLRIKDILFTLPNIIHESVPIGKNDKENVEVEKFGDIPTFDFEVKTHTEIAEGINGADFDISGETSGNGFYYLKGDLALLNMALINFSRDYMVKAGYTYMEPPLMIREDVLKGVYTAHEIEEMSYKIDGEDLYLIATSEHPLIGQFINKTIDEKELPMKLTGYSMCFRKEVGSHGIDERGLYRTHQFNKQEMVVLCKPEESFQFYEEMLGHSVELFKQLGLPIRVLECCSGDLGDLKTKSADLEAWSPRRQEYFEICSCSNLTDAQARRLGIRVTAGKEKYFPHTLNNTAIATSRALVAILENFQDAQGNVKIPDVLVPYMYGKTELKKV